jgi:hypothetical protein
MGVYAGLVLGWILCTMPAGADQFDSMRAYWQNYLTGGGGSPTSLVFSGPVTNLTATASNDWSALNTNANRTYLWSYYPLGTSSSNMTGSFQELELLALAWANPASPLYTNANLATAIDGGLDFMVSNYYTTNGLENGSLWDWQIGSPEALMNTALLMYPTLTSSEITNYCSAIDNYSPGGLANVNGWLTSANTAEEALVMTERGILGKDGARMTNAQTNLLALVFPVVTNGDGFYADGSYIFDTNFSYNGGYGVTLLSDAAELINLLSNSTWQIGGQYQSNVFAWVTNGMEPVIYGGAMMDMTRGRYLSRQGETEFTDGASALYAIQEVAEFAPPATAAALSNFASAPLLTSGQYSFAGMDRVVGLRSGFGVGVSMSSSRVANYESTGGENEHGWFTGDGMTYLYLGSTDTQFTGNYWPTVDAYHLPGTTVEQKTRNNSQDQDMRTTQSWAGGAQVAGTYGTAGMALADPLSPSLAAQKSWFIFDNEVVCLGAGINCADASEIDTTVEDRALGTSPTNYFTVNGMAYPPVVGGNYVMGSVNWCALDGVGGYYFPGGGSNLQATLASSTGQWSAIGNGTNTTIYTNDYLKLWYNHGIAPSNASYAYVLLPNMVASNVASYASTNGDIIVLTNSPTVQAAKKPSLGVVAANFWGTGTNTADIITVNQPSSIVTLSNASSFSVGISDPTQMNTNLMIVTLNIAAVSLVSADPGVTVDQLSPQIVLTVHLSNSMGRSFQASFTTPGSQQPPAITQQPAGGAAAVGSTVSLTVTATGAAPLSYQWQFDGVNLPGTMSTAAGDGVNGYTGDKGQATNAELGAPNGVFVDSATNLYIADSGDDVVRKVTSSGMISTVAGKYGVSGYSGDNGQATNAGMNPVSAALDGAGNVYIADFFNSRVRKVDGSGIITTVAGTGTSGYSGDNGPATNAEIYFPAAVLVDAATNLYIADYVNNRVRKVSASGTITTVAGNGAGAPLSGAYGGDNGPATNASLWHPAGLALDAAGNLYITDSRNYRVRKVNTNGVITTVAGDGSSGVSVSGALATSTSLGNPGGLVVDSMGNLYIADTGNQCVVEVGTRGTLAIYAGILGSNGYSGDGGPASDALLNNPMDVKLDAGGDLFIADSANSRLRKVGAQGKTLTLSSVTTAEAGNYDVVVSNPYGSVTSSVAVVNVGYAPAWSSPLTNEPGQLGANVTVGTATTGSGAILYQWEFNGAALPDIIVTVAGNGSNGYSGDGGMATNAMLYVQGVAVDGFGNVYSADPINSRVRKVSAGGVICTLAGNGSNGFAGDGGTATNAELSYPVAVAADAAGNVYIADQDNNRIREVSTNGTISTVAGNGVAGYQGDGRKATNANLNAPTGVAVDSSGSLYIADRGNNIIRKVTGGIIHTIAGNQVNGFSGDGGTATVASLSQPQGVAVDGLGNVYIADTGNKRVRKVAASGVISTIAGQGYAGYYGDGRPATNALVEYPAGVAPDPFGNLYIADGSDHVREVGANGIIQTVAGNLGSGFSGDGGPATNSRLSQVYGVASDASGNIYMGDTGNNRIREIRAFGPDLVLNNFNFGEAGQYELVLSNAFGTTNSAIIMVTAALGPLTASLEGGPSVELQFTGTPGSNYVLEAASQLTPPIVWQAVATNPAAANGTGTFTDTNIQSGATRFYRLSLP